MNKTVSVTTDLSGVEILVSGTITAPRRGFMGRSGLPQPPEPSEVEDLSVEIVIGGTGIDITPSITARQRAYLSEHLLDEVSWEHG